MSQDSGSGAKKDQREDPNEKGLREVGEAAAAVGQAAGRAAEHAFEAVEHFFTAPIRLPGVGSRKRRRKAAPGAAPGIESMTNLNEPPAADVIHFRQICYGAEAVHDQTFGTVEELLASEKPADCNVRWINVDGLNPYVVHQMQKHFGFHTLAAEDTLNVPQRSKVEEYDDSQFVIVRMLRRKDGELLAEQVSMYVYADTVITIQESPGDVWEPIRERIETATSRFHSNGADYLVYALVDAIVDHCFPILEHYGDILEDLEQHILHNPKPMRLHRVHTIKRELSLLRRVMWPLRDCIDTLYRDEQQRITPNVRMYMRDVYDHTIQVIDIIETYRELASGLTDLYMSAVGNRMNEIMKVLTIIGALFIPITFIAGVYGMNFSYIPGLEATNAFWVFVAACVVVFVGMLVYFRRKGWLG